MKQSPVLTLDDVWKTYQLGELELTVLRGIHLEIYPGDFVSIMGPSGSGKSTLLHLVGCLDIPSRGKILLNGKNIAELNEDARAQVRGKTIGFVFQQFHLLHNLTAVENVMLPMIFQGVPEKKRRERAFALLTSFNLGKRMHHKPTELSGGEQQRVAIARALANNPSLIVADEPTGNLDSQTGKMIMGILTDLHQKEGKTVIVVTHDPAIARYSKKIIHLQDGQMVGDHFHEEKVLWPQ